MATIQAAVIKSNFAAGVKTARRLHGTYDATTMLWSIPDVFASVFSDAGFSNPQNPGLVLHGTPKYAEYRQSGKIDPKTPE